MHHPQAHTQLTLDYTAAPRPAQCLTAIVPVIDFIHGQCRLFFTESLVIPISAALIRQMVQAQADYIVLLQMKTVSLLLLIASPSNNAAASCALQE